MSAKPRSVRPERVLLYAAGAIALLRFLLVIHAGVSYWDGDFLATMPGPHVERLNPALWASPDLMGTSGHDRFIYGPTQHLTLLPFTLLDSYRQIARLLLAIYAALMIASLFLMSATFGEEQGSRHQIVLLLAIAMFFFPPAMQALLQREFEVVIFAGFNLAAYSLVKGREGRAGAALGYITWFKYFPVLSFVYLLIRRRIRAAAAYLAVSCLVLAAAHLIFGLGNFGRTATQAEGFLRTLVGAGAGFCTEWSPADQTSANLQWGLCGLAHRWPWFPARGAFYAIMIVAGAVALRTFMRFERGPSVRPDLTRWRTLHELSLLAIAMSFLIHNHYHYLILLLFPVSALASLYWTTGTLIGPKGCLLAASYVLLGAFVTSPTVFTRILGVSGWDLFAERALYLYGGLLLLALVLTEYHRASFGLRSDGRRPMTEQTFSSMHTAISIVVPIFRSAGTLTELHARVTAAMSRRGESYELMFVDDACPEGSGDLAEALARADSAVRVVRLKENQGQHRAALIGISRTAGSRIVVMDADLQDPPEAIPQLIAGLVRGAEAVFARSIARGESTGREATSRLFKLLVNPLFGLPTGVGVFLAMTRQMRDRLLVYPPRHVYLPGMIGLSGLPAATMAIGRAPRNGGGSAYSEWKRIRFAFGVVCCFLECYFAPTLRFFTRAGFPATIAASGTSCVTTAPAAITAPLPIETRSRTIAPKLT